MEKNTGITIASTPSQPSSSHSGSTEPIEFPIDSVEIGEQIGEGKFTNIFRCQCADLHGVRTVIKMLKPSEDDGDPSGRFE